MKIFHTLVFVFLGIVGGFSQTLWSGAVDSDWNNPANWSQGVPGSGATAVILAAPTNQPVYGGATVINLTIENFGSLTFNSTVYNTGAITNFASATIINDGLFVNAGTIFFNNDGNLENNGAFENYGTYDHAASAILNNSSAASFISYGLFNSNGQINNSGQLNIIGVFSNTNGMDNDGTFTISGDASFPASSSLNNSTTGNVNITGTGKLVMNGTLPNEGAISNAGEFLVQNASTLTNSGTIVNSDEMVIAGTLNNNASLTNGSSLMINSAGVLENNDVVQNNGNIVLEICAKLIQNAGNNIGGSIANDGLVFEINGTVNEVNGDFGDSFTDINDTPDPVPACKGDLILELDENGLVTFTGEDVDRGRSYGTCGGQLVSYDVSPNSFTTADIGIRAVTLTITDNFGKTASCEDFVNVIPFQEPIVPVDDPNITFSCPTDISIATAPGAQFAEVSWTEPTATTDCTIASSSLLEIRARGNEGGEEMELWINANKVYTWEVSDHYEIYTFNGESDLSPSDVEIKFVNDFFDGAAGIDFNLYVDKITIDGTDYQSESADVLKYGSAGHCQVTGYFNVQVLNCNGFFQYGNGTVSCASLPDAIDGFVYMGAYSGSKYYCTQNNYSWAEAEVLVESHGGHMVTINNSGENDFIKANMVADAGWIGYNDIASEGNFVWENGENPGYTNWFGGEPNNYNNSDGVVLLKSSGLWRDRQVTDHYEVVMEIPCDNGTAPTCAAPGTLAGMSTIGEYNNSRYFISNNNTNWNTANDFAIANGGYLVDITSHGENEFVRNAFSNGSIWTGLERIGNPHIFNWTSGQNLVYTNWQNGEPNSGNSSVAARLRKDTGMWTDRPKTDNYRYVIEVPCNDGGSGGGGDPELTVTQIGGPLNASNFPAGTTEVAYQVTDDCDNEEICTFEVTVNEVPADFEVTFCPGDVTINTLPGATTAIGTWDDPTGTTDCFRTGPVGIEQTLGLPKGSDFPVGTASIAYAVFDSCGNFESCLFNVTINQVLSTLNVSGCPDNFNVVADEGATTAPVSWTEPTATTDCFLNSNTTVTQLSGPANGTDFPLGTTEVIYLFADDCSNTEVCSFTVLVNSPCTNNGGDADGDGVCADIDCDDNDPSIPTTPGSACDDGDSNTANDSYEADGCTCSGTIIDPCLNNGGDADGDGICADVDCDDNNGAVPTAPGTTCDDNDPLTENDVIQIDGCTCAGALPVTLSVQDVSVAESAGSVNVDICLDMVSNVDVQFSYLTSSGTALAAADFGFGIGNPVIDAGLLCTTVSVLIVDDAEEEGDEQFTVDISSPINATIANGSGVVTILANDGPDPCANNGGDADGDGICADVDCDDNDATLPAVAGTACDDGDATTENDVIGADGCTCSGTVIDPCANEGGDADGDGICLNNDCNDNDASVPALPGTPCDDGNPLTAPDLIEADGCTCNGVMIDPCASNGGDADGDGICADVDCDDNDATLPAVAGTACDDGDANTENDVIGADGCTCSGTVIDPCANNGGDADGDGICADVDCDDNDATLPAVAGTTCDDGDATTENDVIGADGCSCAGTPISTGCNPTYTINGNTVTISGLTGAHNSVIAYLQPSWTVTFDCFDDCPSSFDLPDGDYYLHIKVFDAGYQIECQLQEYITIDGSTACNPGGACNDGDDCTDNDLWDVDCNCVGTAAADADSDGVCANEDCDDNDPTLPTIAGTACDDGNADTENDVIGADGCSCAGTPINTGCNPTYTISGNTLTVSGLTGAHNSINLYNIPGWSGAYDCFDNCPSSIELPDGEYNLHIKVLDAGYQIECQLQENITIDGSGGCNVGGTCDDGDACTDNDVLDADCNCAGTSTDADGDGVCANEDCDDNDASLPTTPGTTCDDGNPDTDNDVIGADGCSCAGTTTFPCTNNGGDADGDGVCADVDCDDTDPNLPAAAGTACDDGDANTENDVIGADGCSCSGTVINDCANNGGDADGDGICADVDCDDNDASLPAVAGTTCDDGDATTENDVIGADGCSCAGTPISTGCNPTYTINGNTLSVNGLNGAHNSINLYQIPGWAGAYDCFDNCPSDIVLADGEYNLHIKVLDENYQIVCQLQEFITIDGSSACNPGGPCNDGDDCTDNDLWDVDCNCVGTVTDADGDGVCAAEDCDDADASLPAVVGTTCDDGDANTENDVIGADGCTCAGVDPSGCNITVTPTPGTITIDGLNGDHVIVQVFDDKWVMILNCLDDCDNPQIISGLAAGTYYVKATNYDENWLVVCDNVDYYTVTGAANLQGQDEESLSLDGLVIYPNPASSQVNIELSDLIGKAVDVQIYNQLGQVMDTRSIDVLTADALTFDLTRYTSGVYAVTIKTENNKRITKLFVVTKL